MSTREDSRGAGWTVLKVIGVILASIAMLGFGVCGICGLAIAGNDADIIALGLAGLLIAAGALAIVVWIVRSANRGRS